MPVALFQTLVDAARYGPPPKKRARPNNRVRDIFIAAAVARAYDFTGLPLKQSDSSKCEKVSCCMIVQRALRRTGTNLSAKTIFAIYEKLKPPLDHEQAEVMRRYWSGLNK